MKKELYDIWLYIKHRIWYLILLFTSSYFIYINRADVLALEFNKFNLINLIFVFWIVLLVLPLFSEMELFGVKLKKEVEKNKAELKDSIYELKSQILELKISNSLANSQSISIYNQLPTDKEVEQLLDDVAKTSTDDKVQPQNSVDDFISETSIYLFKVRLTLEKQLGILCEKTGYVGNAIALPQMITHIVKNGLIDEKILDYVLQVSRICNRGIHGEIISAEYIKLVEALLPKILSELNTITSRLGYKYFFVCPRCRFSGYSEFENVCPACKFVSDE